jgi:hypothetical protein
MDLANKAYDGKAAFSGFNVIKCNEANSKYHPNYFLIDNDDALYVVVRGSHSGVDWETDFDFAEVTKKFGSESITCHRGFYNSALNIFNEIKSTLKQYSSKNIIVTGHSLGGAVTSVLGVLIMLDSATKNLKSYAIAFAPAPALSYVPASVNKRLVSIVNNKDIITTLCIPATYNLIKGAIPEGGFNKLAVKIALTAAMAGLKKLGVPFGDDLYNAATGSIDSIVDAVAMYHEDKNSLKVKHIGGVIYRLTKNCKLANSIASPSDFETISVSFTCVNDHVPANYVSLLETVQ